METKELIGKKVESVLVYPSGPIHPAWVNDLTPPINTSTVFLKLSDSNVLCINPCEVELSAERYPSLGLELETCESIGIKQFDGRVIEAVPIVELSESLPQTIIEVEESDPLEEGAISQYAIQLESGDSILVQHIMPPMTLGVSVAYAE